MGLVAGLVAARADESRGTFVVVSDFHFNPLAAPEIAASLAASEPREWPGIFATVHGQAFARRGQDTNHALFHSALGALSEIAANVDLVIVPGDLLAHDFEKSAAKVLATSPTSEAVRSFAVKTEIYVADALRAALPGRPIVIALGNNDSECGDYELQPGGAFLLSSRDTLRETAGADLLAADFDTTYGAGGYYAMRHPRLEATTILVVNDVLWSSDYRESCGTGRYAAAETMMAWLEARLAEERAAGRQVWLVHHIPVGIDSYTTFETGSNQSCPVRVVPFLREPFASRFVELMRDYAATIQASFAGHTHQDDYRLVMQADQAVGVEKVAPSISPIFGNNPGFHLFDYDRRSGTPTDFSTWSLANLDLASPTVPGEWRREYTFTEAYAQQSYSPATVSRIVQELSEAGGAGDKAREVYRRFYPVDHGEIHSTDLPAYLCALRNLDRRAFSTCYCGRDASSQVD